MRHWIAIAMILSACSDDNATPDSRANADAPLTIDGPVDARPPDGPPPSLDGPSLDAPLASFTCKQLSDMAVPLMNALDKTCDDESDCEIVNLPTVPPNCSQMPILGGGDRAARKGWTNAELTALRAEFLARCQTTAACQAGLPCPTDWRPPLVSCLGHTCGAQGQSCIPPPPDAGP